MIIYKTINLINNKIYIGQTNGKRKNYLGSGTKLKKAINKYGFKNFKVEILENNIENIDELNRLEKYYINLYDSTNPEIGYNLIKGGTGLHIYNNYKKEFFSKIRKGLKKSKETCDKIRLSKLGIKYSNNTRLKMAKSHMKKVIVLNNDNTFDKEFESIKDCSIYLNCNMSTISRVLSGKYKSIKNKKVIYK